jgi:hypothetical protein
LFVGDCLGNYKENYIRINPASFPPPRRVNMHPIDDFIDLDHIIDYTVMKHDVDYADPIDDSKADNDGGNELLAYMAGQKSACGDVRRVLASKQTPGKNKKLQANENTSTPSSVTIDGLTYYLNKGQTLNFQGNQYTAHMTRCHYRVGKHDFSDLEYALVDRGASGGICGSNMKVLEGSEMFVDVVGLAGHKVSQLHIVTAQALLTTYKGDAIATFHQMALLPSQWKATYLN